MGMARPVPMLVFTPIALAPRRSRAHTKAMSHSEEPTSIPVRPVFDTLPSYAAGKPPVPVEGLTRYKLSSNENPLGPVPEGARVLAEFDAGHRYPDPLSAALRPALAGQLGVDAEDIVTGAGSLGALNQILKTFAGVNADGVQDEVIYAWRSFEAYPILVGIMGARSVQVPNLPDGAHDLDAMAAAVTDRTRLILVCTPNNPTGPAVTESQIRSFLAKVPATVPVVIDEAYFEFCAASSIPEGEEPPLNGLDIYRDYPNVIILRTFSKAQGLAGFARGLLDFASADYPPPAGCRDALCRVRPGRAGRRRLHRAPGGRHGAGQAHRGRA